MFRYKVGKHFYAPLTDLHISTKEGNLSCEQSDTRRFLNFVTEIFERLQSITLLHIEFFYTWFDSDQYMKENIRSLVIRISIKL